MVAADAAPQHHEPTLTPVLHLLRQLGERRDVHDLAVDKPGSRLAVRRSIPETVDA